jgi:hypothetical protein
VQKHLFEYNAARTNRLYAPKQYGQPAESTQNQRDRVVMMWEARDLVENFPEAREISRKFGNYLTPHEYSPTTGDRGYNQTISEYFHAWCKNCDVTNRHSFKKLVQLAAEERPVDGDCGFVIRRGADGLKTCYTSAAGFCLAATAEREGRRLIVVVVGSPDAKSRDIKVAELVERFFARGTDLAVFQRADESPFIQPSASAAGGTSPAASPSTPPAAESLPTVRFPRPRS